MKGKIYNINKLKGDLKMNNIVEFYALELIKGKTINNKKLVNIKKSLLNKLKEYKNNLNIVIKQLKEI